MNTHASIAWGLILISETMDRSVSSLASARWLEHHRNAEIHLPHSSPHLIHTLLFSLKMDLSTQRKEGREHLMKTSHVPSSELEAWHSFSPHKNPPRQEWLLSHYIEGGTEVSSERLSNLLNITQLVIARAGIWVHSFLFQSPCYVAYRTKDQTGPLNCRLLENKSHTLNLSIFPTALTKEKALHGQWKNGWMNACMHEWTIQWNMGFSHFLLGVVCNLICWWRFTRKPKAERHQQPRNGSFWSRQRNPRHIIWRSITHKIQYNVLASILNGFLKLANREHSSQQRLDGQSLQTVIYSFQGFLNPFKTLKQS